MVKSFEVDHINMIAPTIRVSDEIDVKGSKIIKYDLRFKKPYTEDVLDGAAIHTIEHLVATALREGDVRTKVIDFSPMGCRTGFYLTVLDPVENFSHGELLDVLKAAARIEEIPGATKESCGNYQYHNLKIAREELAKFISGVGEA